MSSIFLSHNHADKPFVKRLANDLNQAGIKTWVDEAEINVGDSLIAKIEEGINKMEYLGVVLSKRSVNSEWVKREVDIAMNQEINGKKVKVLPLLIEDCELPGFLIGKLYADFRREKLYQDGLSKLLHTLGQDITQRRGDGGRATKIRLWAKFAAAIAVFVIGIVLLYVWLRREPPSSTNVALASNGGVATASSTPDPNDRSDPYYGYGFVYPPSGVNNGDRKGLNWMHGGGWRDGTDNKFPDWLQVDFSGTKTIGEIDVFTLQDDYGNPDEPTLSMTFDTWGITDFDVQYWDGSQWVTVPGGSVTGNNKVWRQFLFSSVATSKIRVQINNALMGNCRVVELEAH